MHFFQYKIYIYDFKGRCISVFGFDEWDDAFKKYQDLLNEKHAYNWTIEIHEIKRRAEAIR